MRKYILGYFRNLDLYFDSGQRMNLSTLFLVVYSEMGKFFQVFGTKNFKASKNFPLEFGSYGKK